MGYRILFFYKKENAFYKEKRAVNLSFNEREPEDGVRVFFCGLPEYYANQVRWGGWRKGNRICPVPWNFGQLLRLMQNCCEYVSADAYYLEEHFERELAEGYFGFSPGRQRMCGAIMRNMSGQFRGIDSVLYLADRDGETAGELPLPEDLLRKLHYFFYLGERSGRAAALEDNLWQEYGMPLIFVKKPEELVTCQIRRLLVLDDRQEGGADWAMLPRGCVYQDLWSVSERRAEIAGNRGDIKYVSEYLYLARNLDTSKESGYNVREGSVSTAHYRQSSNTTNQERKM